MRLNSPINKFMPFWCIAGLLVLGVAAGCSSTDALTPEAKEIHAALLQVEDDPATPDVDEKVQAQAAADELVSDAEESRAGAVAGLVQALVPGAQIAGAVYGVMNLLSPRVRQNSIGSLKKAKDALAAFSKTNDKKFGDEAATSIQALLASLGMAHTPDELRKEAPQG